ncbi:serine hydrolase domain-containing protein [Phenylobacterium conjunctum]|uniref:Serine hydrolase domain-containing protein n=1 Tax=Phenylobacterium conjunctum TaxID=1298959 RepID=A0ABW3T395_9CAUL
MTPLSRRTALALLAAGLARPTLAADSALADMACAGLITVRPDGAEQTLLRGPEPFDLDRPFRVASVSKMIAAAVFMTHALETRLDLDADVSPWLGFRLRHPAWPDRVISARLLLSHRSGLRNGPSYPVPLGHDLAEAFQPGGRHWDDGGWFGPADKSPGEWFAYADVNFALLAQILEARTGERFDLYMRRRLFAPLSLEIGYNWSGVGQARRDRAMPGLRRQNGRWVPQVDASPPPAPDVAVVRTPGAPSLEAYRLGSNGFLFSPQGGLRLSVRDLSRLGRMFVRGGEGVLPRRAIELMQRPVWAYTPTTANGETDGVFQGYGLGVERPRGAAGPQGDDFFGPGSARWAGHLGDAYGWMSGLFWNRDSGAILAWALNGMPETARPPSSTSSLTAPEAELVGLGLALLE